MQKHKSTAPISDFEFRIFDFGLIQVVESAKSPLN